MKSLYKIPTGMMIAFIIVFILFITLTISTLSFKLIRDKSKSNIEYGVYITIPF